MGYKREEIYGTTPQDLKKLNDNIRNLWFKCFGDIDLGDLNDSSQKIINSKMSQGDFDSYVTQTEDKIELAVENNVNKVHKVRYIRDWLNGSTVDMYSHWVELMAFVGDTNVALNKIVTSDGTLRSGKPAFSIYVDGDYQAENHTELNETGAFHYLQVDLGQVYDNIDYIKTWHYYGTSRAYNNKVEISEDGVNWIVLFDSAISGKFTENVNGHIIMVNTGTNANSQYSKITQLSNSISSKVSAGDMSSLIQQNADSVKIAFGNTASTNLLHNGRGLFGLQNWRNNGLTDVWFPAVNGNGTPFASKDGFGLVKYTDGEGLFESDTIKVTPGKTYTFQGRFQKEYNVRSFEVYLIGSANNDRGYGWYPNMVAPNFSNDPQLISFTFTVPSNINYLYIRIDHNGSVSSSGSYVVFVTDLMLVEGDKVGEWTPHAGEICNDTTEITGAGIKVKHSDGSYTEMKSDGFRRHTGVTNRDYHYLSEIGSVNHNVTGPSDTVTVTLDSAFRGKDFKVITSVSKASPDGSYICAFSSKIESIDITNGTFTFSTFIYSEVGAYPYFTGNMIVSWMAVA